MLIPCLVTELTTTSTSNGVTYEEFTATELISNPFKKVRAELQEGLLFVRGMNATIFLPELHEESDPVSI